MPLKLAVIALVVALSMPMLADALDAFDRDMQRTRCRLLAEDIRDRAEEAVAAGPGNVRIFHVERPTGVGMHLRIGGSPEDSDRILVTCSGMTAEVRCVDPRVLFNGTLDADIGPWDLVLEATAMTEGHNLDMRRSG
jgi:hypothetical protein